MGIIVKSTPENLGSMNNSRMSFQVDGINQGSYSYTASVGSLTTYSYNTTFFAMDDLSDGLHNITMICGDDDPESESVCLLDRFIYT